jgi:hypothetical protein
VVHISIQQNHLHLLVEADSRDALSAGMKWLAIAAARAVNRACCRRGKVFAYRYHATQIRSPRQARHALAYVLNNWRRHRKDLGEPRALVDRYSSAVSFTGWLGVASFLLPDDYERLPVARPQSWLLAVSWQRHGLIALRERPGPL